MAPLTAGFDKNKQSIFAIRGSLRAKTTKDFISTSPASRVAPLHSGGHSRVVHALEHVSSIVCISLTTQRCLILTNFLLVLIDLCMEGAVV